MSSTVENQHTSEFSAICSNQGGNFVCNIELFFFFFYLQWSRGIKQGRWTWQNKNIVDGVAWTEQRPRRAVFHALLHNKGSCSFVDSKHACCVYAQILFIRKANTETTCCKVHNKHWEFARRLHQEADSACFCII